VPDGSVTLAWVYGDETTEPIRELFDAIADSGAVVPALWRLEVANSLTVAVRRGRIDAEFRQAALTDLALLDITTDPYTDAYAWAATLRLADSFRLSSMTPPIWSLRSAANCRSPRSTRTYAPRPPHSACACSEAPHNSAFHAHARHHGAKRTAPGQSPRGD
jgi:predicted nucleic acid-binding protein